MRVAALCNFNEFVDDVLRCRLIGITHAEIDDVLAATSRVEFQLVDLIEYVRRQALDTRELFSQNDYTTQSEGNGPEPRYSQAPAVQGATHKYITFRRSD